MSDSPTDLPLFVIEFDRYDERVVDNFYDEGSARECYLRMRRLGRNPVVINGHVPPAWLKRVITVPGFKGQPYSNLPKPPRLGVAPHAPTRAYHAGRVIARFGHANGVTDPMVAAVDAAYGTDNAPEALTATRNAWQAIRGFFEEMGLDLPQAPGTLTPK